MSLPGEITIPFGDGRYKFVLPLGQVRELQEKTGVGPLALLRRIDAGNWLIDDLRETIRLGRIGAGEEPVAALKLVERYCDARPPAEYVPTAHAILLAFVMGVPAAKKKPGPKTEKTTTEQAGSTSTASTGPAAPSDSAPNK